MSTFYTETQKMVQTSESQLLLSISSILYPQKIDEITIQNNINSNDIKFKKNGKKGFYGIYYVVKI